MFGKKIKFFLIFISITSLLLASCENPGEDTRKGQENSQETTALAEYSEKLRCQPVQEAFDLALARENARTSCVRVEAGEGTDTYWGSGVIWAEQQEAVVIAASGHLLEGRERITVTFHEGTTVAASLKGVDREQDIGFVEIKKEDITESLAKELAWVRLHERHYSELREGDSVFLLGCSQSGSADVCQEGTMVSTDYSLEDFGEHLLLVQCEADPGMSGGGIFDGYGNFIGLLVAGNGNQVIALTMPQTNKAYWNLYGISRDPADYSV